MCWPEFWHESMRTHKRRQPPATRLPLRAIRTRETPDKSRHSHSAKAHLSDIKFRARDRTTLHLWHAASGVDDSPQPELSMTTSLPLPPHATRRHRRPAWPRPRTALCVLLCAALPALAQAPASGAPAAAPADQSAQTDASGTDAQRKQTANRRVDNAARVAQSMAAAPKMAALLERARGVYIIPHYGRAALAVGAEGGAGVLLVRRDDGSWSDPAFFDTGAIGVGLQAGVQEGPLAFVLMNQRAVDHFRSKHNFSISADAGLTVITYARMAEGSTSGDVVAWSGAKGLFANAVTVAVNDVRYNQRLSDAYYGKALSVRQILEGGESIGQAEPLRKALGGDGSKPPAR